MKTTAMKLEFDGEIIEIPEMDLPLPRKLKQRAHYYCYVRLSEPAAPFTSTEPPEWDEIIERWMLEGEPVVLCGTFTTDGEDEPKIRSFVSR